MSFDAGGEVLLDSEPPLAVDPAAGMDFASPEVARAFYCAYAARAGFRVRSSKSFTSRVDDAVIMRHFVCTRQGLPSRKDPLDASKKRRNRPSARAGCPAMLQVNRRPVSAATARWVVSRCVLEHSHPLGGDHADDADDTDTPRERSSNSSQLPSAQNGNGNAEPFQRGAWDPAAVSRRACSSISRRCRWRIRRSATPSSSAGAAVLPMSCGLMCVLGLGIGGLATPWCLT